MTSKERPQIRGLWYPVISNGFCGDCKAYMLSAPSLRFAQLVHPLLGILGIGNQCPWRNLIDCANRAFAIFRQQFAHNSYFASLAKRDHYRDVKTLTGHFPGKY
jgi:hypothetical protein